MKRMIALLICGAILLTGCTPTKKSTNHSTDVISEVETTEEVVAETITETLEITDLNDVDISYRSLDDENLLSHIEDLVYSETVKSLDSDKYFVENVSAIYISKEYLEEVAYNSQSNVYFGYTIAELNDLFEGSKYVFTLGEDGTTIVQELVEIEDNDTEQILQNVAIGTGVIFLCVTVSVVSGGVGAPAISMIFAASAKTGTVMALSSGAFGAVSAGIVRGIETGDMNEALEAAALSGSDGFKWGAIGGSVSGGTSQAISLKGATLKGLTLNEAAMIQKESKLPLDFIKNFHSVNEYNVYKNSDLQVTTINGKYAFTQKIDWDFIGDIEDGRTNAQRVLDGLSPLDSTGKPYEIHHIGQEANSPFAILTHSQHHDNYTTLHSNTGATESKINRTIFEKEKDEFWKSFYEMTQGA
ncbi:MAG: hypothetical protein E7508_01310 [Ruminococcus sp.]|nr:hypothetical protein [Ruminococcus sp.]